MIHITFEKQWKCLIFLYLYKPSKYVTTNGDNGFDRLDEIGYGCFQPENQNHTIKLFLEPVEHAILRAAVDQ